MAASEYSKAVELGLKLSKRIYYGNNAAVTIPPYAPPMTTDGASHPDDSHLPTAVMAYAEVSDPRVVDNPDVPSYQPYVHGRCDPPALIPLQMRRVEMEVECCLDTAFVTVSGAWRVHCVATSGICGLRVAVPMGEQGSILGVEIEIPDKSYATELVSLESIEDSDVAAKSNDGFLIKGHIYTLKIPRVVGGAMISIKVRWSQKLLYENGRFRLNVPFTFPSYVNPVLKNALKKEKISVNLIYLTKTEVVYESRTHPLKRVGDESGEVEFCCEREVPRWSTKDFSFSYDVCSNDIVGGLLLQSPSVHDYDQRETFCLYLCPRKEISKKVFRKDVVYLVDMGLSMQGTPLENVKTVLIAALLRLNPMDSFNIIAFNEGYIQFSSSSSLVPATKEMIDEACEWIRLNIKPQGLTNISTPLKQAMEMFSRAADVIQTIFLITDGSVEDEKEICDSVKGHLDKGRLPNPRICTFGIGLYCNHYFLQMLAHLGRGYYDAALDVDSINPKLERLIRNAYSVIVADITIDSLNDIDSIEICPISNNIQDLSYECPLLMYGRYTDEIPDIVEVSGTLADSSKFMINVRAQRSKDIIVPIDRVFAREHINALTAHAWFSGSKQHQEKAAKISLQTGFSSEYTSMVLHERDKIKLSSKFDADTKKTTGSFKDQKQVVLLRNLGVGFGNIKATIENHPIERAGPRLYESSEMMLRAAAIAGSVTDRCCCCVCLLHFCGRINDQCAVVLTQICTILACCECLNVCYDVCICD